MAEHAALVALVVLAAATEEAVSAGRAEAAKHAVALGDLGNGVAGREHRSHELVSECEARLDLHASVVDVQVGAADAGCLDPHDRVIRGQQLGLRTLLEPHLAGRLEGHRLHFAPEATGGG
jgi:hypothetical protein